MKKFSELVKYWSALAGTKDMAQWCVSMALDRHLQNKAFWAIMEEQEKGE